ncbi:MAG: response regulator, partial [Anaerolineales bacterium]|nr:response regulator [Anaerolineales bacterium]
DKSLKRRRQQTGREIDILLVEDNPDHVELIIRVLQDNNVLNEVYVVTNGEDALDFLYQRGAYADARRPGLILLDIKLPRVDGIEVLRQIKADAKLKAIPVVMLTTSAGEREMVESYHYGANSYIVKPVDFEQFVKAIKELKLYWLVLNSLPTEHRP